MKIEEMKKEGQLGVVPQTDKNNPERKHQQEAAKQSQSLLDQDAEFARQLAEQEKDRLYWERIANEERSDALIAQLLQSDKDVSVQKKPEKKEEKENKDKDEMIQKLRQLELDFEKNRSKTRSAQPKKTSPKSKTPEIEKKTRHDRPEIDPVAQVLQAEEDARVAQRLRREEENARLTERLLQAEEESRTVQRLRQAEEGARTAHLLSVGSLPRFSFLHSNTQGESKASSEKNKIRVSQAFEALVKLNLLLQSKAMNQTDIDAHTHTRTLVKEGMPQVINFDNQFQLSKSDLTVERVRKEVLALGFSEYANNIQTTLNAINEKSPIETAETNVDVVNLLSRTWSLANQLDVYQEKIAYILNANVQDKGGCLAGLVARLYPVYTEMVKMCVENIVGIDPYDNRDAREHKQEKYNGK